MTAAPFAACGFFTYHGMTAEQVLWAWFKSEILCPKRLMFKSDSYYYEAVQPAIRAGMKRKRGLPTTLYRILRFLQNHGAILITTKTNLQYELYLTGLENRLLNRTRQRKPVWICEDCKDGEC